MFTYNCPQNPVIQTHKKHYIYYLNRTNHDLLPRTLENLVKKSDIPQLHAYSTGSKPVVKETDLF